MEVDKKGKEILKEAHFDRFRQAFIDSLMEKISLEGKYGCDIRSLIEETLKEEAFVDFVHRLAEIIERKTTMSKKESEETAYTLIEEDVANDVRNILHGQLEEKRNFKHSKVEEQIYSKGKELKLWKGVALKRFLGKRASRWQDILRLLREHGLGYVILTGVGLLIVSAVLFGSLYKALVVGLTLTIFAGETLRTKIGNILGGIGGVLIFFTSMTILIEYILLAERRSELIRELAKEYFRRKRS